jgi:hypothetical protein
MSEFIVKSIEESPMSISMVNFIAIIVRRSGAMSLKPC